MELVMIRVHTVETAPTIAPPLPARRRRPLPIEPLIFALLLMALTLGINTVLPSVEANTASDTAPKAPQAKPAEVARIAQVI
jgi:hypothetical protein